MVRAAAAIAVAPASKRRCARELRCRRNVHAITAWLPLCVSRRSIVRCLRAQRRVPLLWANAVLRNPFPACDPTARRRSLPRGVLVDARLVHLRHGAHSHRSDRSSMDGGHMGWRARDRNEQPEHVPSGPPCRWADRRHVLGVPIQQPPSAFGMVARKQLHAAWHVRSVRARHEHGRHGEATLLRPQ